MGTPPLLCVVYIWVVPALPDIHPNHSNPEIPLIKHPFPDDAPATAPYPSVMRSQEQPAASEPR
jgi:hypothetical protein